MTRILNKLASSHKNHKKAYQIVFIALDVIVAVYYSYVPVLMLLSLSFQHRIARSLDAFYGPILTFVDPMTAGVAIASLVFLVQMILLKNKLAMTLVGLMYAVIFLTTFCGGIIMQFEPLVPLLAYYMILYPLTVALCMMGRMHLNRVRDLERLLHTEEDERE